jgi:hypothetical protein
MLSNTSTPWAPWYVIPADNKPFARLAAGAVILDTLIKINPRYPTVSADARAAFADAREELTGGKPAAAAGAATDASAGTGKTARRRRSS